MIQWGVRSSLRERGPEESGLEGVEGPVAPSEPAWAVLLAPLPLGSDKRQEVTAMCPGYVGG